MSAKNQIVHHVFFWLKNPLSGDDTAQLIDGLKTLKAIAQIKKLLIGTPASTLKREVIDNSFQVSELIYFDSVQDQNDYQIHPLHVSFVEKYGHLWEKVMVYDMIVNSD
ncbi:MAG TPA: Dabb family protein [Arachidicoccus sp.]